MPIHHKTFTKNSDQRHFDAILIGSGLGSMTVANILAREGKKSLILEKHTVPGGFTHVFKRKGVEFDVGVHYIGDVHRKKSLMKSAFEFLTDRELKWAPMDEVYDTVIINNEKFPFYAGPEKFVEELGKQFPNHRSQILRYVKEMKKITKKADIFFVDKVMPKWISNSVMKLLRKRFHKLASTTTYDYLKEYIDDDKLITVLTGQWGDYGLHPKESSIVIHAMVFKHFVHGGAYPVGGSKNFFKTFNRKVEEAGGQVLIGANVKKILIKDNVAYGVELDNGEQFYAKTIVSGAGIPASMSFCPELKKSFKPTTQSLPPSAAHFSLYLVLDKSPKELGIPQSNQWIYNSSQPWDDMDNFLSNNKDFPVELNDDFPLLYASFGSSKDPLHTGEKYAMEVITLAPYKWFDKFKNSDKTTRPEEYEFRKEMILNKLLNQTLKHLPEISPHIIHKEISTPLTTKYYCNYEFGQIYGLTHAKERFLTNDLRPKTNIKNLFLTGQDIATAGIGGAVISGILTSITITKKNYMNKIMKLHK